MKTRKSNSHPMDHAMIRKRKRIQRKAKRFQKYLKEKEKEEDKEARMAAKIRNAFRRTNRETMTFLENLNKNIIPLGDFNNYKNTFKGFVEEFIKKLPTSNIIYSICPRCLNAFGTIYGDLGYEIIICGSCLLMLVLMLVKDQSVPFQFNFEFIP